MTQQPHLGVPALKLLAEEWMVAVLHGLAEGALRPAELERGLPDGGHSLVMRRLRHLLDNELVTYERQPGLPPHARSAGIPRRAHYSLTDAGRMLLEIPAEAGRWEQRWCAQAERGAAAGAVAIKALADDHTREIALPLADGPLCTSELDERAPGLGRSALRRRLRELLLTGMLQRSNQGRVPVYELTAGARHLASVAMLAGRWEWRWARPEHPAPGRDLAALLHLLAPVARVPEAVAGICRLHVDTRGAEHSDIYLAVSAGDVLALSEAPAAPAEAAGHASADAWCDALLIGEGSIAISGDEALLAAVIAALGAALLA
jgi:DNA-binding HxlR family transcriptional regulator